MFENYGSVNSDRVHRVSGWRAMVEIDRRGQEADEDAQAEAARLLAWLD